MTDDKQSIPHLKPLKKPKNRRFMVGPETERSMSRIMPPERPGRVRYSDIIGSVAMNEVVAERVDGRAPPRRQLRRQPEGAVPPEVIPEPIIGPTTLPLVEEQL